MRIAQTIGTVTLNRVHPSLTGGRFKLIVPMSEQDLTGHQTPNADSLVAYDELGAGIGSLILVSEGAEAAQPFRPEEKPVDAYTAGILDDCHISPT